MMFGGALGLIGIGSGMIGYYFLGTQEMLVIAALGGIFLVLGLILLGSWVGKAYTYICMDCFMRIDLGVWEALTALPAGGECRRVYCPKCRKRTSCKARRISLRAHVF